MENIVKRSIKTLHRACGDIFVDKTTATGHIEKVGMLFSEREFNGVILNTSCTRNKAKGGEMFRNL